LAGPRTPSAGFPFICTSPSASRSAGIAAAPPSSRRTLEEIGLRGRETFRAAGGGELTLIPCPNDHPRWLETLKKMAKDWLERPTHQAEAEQASGLLAR